VLIVPLDKLAVVIDRGIWTRRLNGRLATQGIASESVAETVKLKVPLCEGVPASTPAVLKIKPVGKVPETRPHL
jgi:hypothetical protein